MPELNTVTDPNLPEPKGASTANTNTFYVSNGAGSGSWKTAYLQGWYDYADTGTSQPLTSGSWVNLTNDGLGSNTRDTYKLPGYGAIWDTSNNQFDWSGAGLQLGDTVDIRPDITFTTSGANDAISLRLDMASGDAGEFPLVITKRGIKTAGTTQVTDFFSVYMGTTLVLNNPAKLSAWTDNTGNSVSVAGWYVRVIPRNPVFL